VTGLTQLSDLGVMRGLDENERKDGGERTFAELLEYGADRFEQRRGRGLIFEGFEATGEEGEGFV
jgi:hypothetical protein